MADEKKRRPLGRGLSALLGEDGEDMASLEKLRVSKLAPIGQINPGRYQPRRTIDEEYIKDLAQSIREKGILQPILVRRIKDQADAYEIIAGERRWRAAQQAKLHEIPIIIKDFSDQEALEAALVENLQRQDLSPLEEANGYQRLMKEFTHTQETLAKAVGKSRSHVANMMRLLGLPDAVKEMLDQGKLSAGHARALLNAGDPSGLARQVWEKGLNVRQTEQLVSKKSHLLEAKTEQGYASSTNVDTLALERELTNLLGLKVTIKFKDGKGSIAIQYKTLEQLDGVLNRLSYGTFGVKTQDNALNV